MKRVCLLMFVSALLATLGFAQTPGTGSTTDQANVQGCLAGSEGNYTVAEDGTGQIYKITSSSVDLKPHLGHDVKLAGNKASGTAGSGAADNSIAVTGLNMISEHCAAAAAAAPVAPSATASTPPVDPAAPAATASPAPATASTPAAPVAPSATASTPAVETAAPAVPSATVSAPAVDTAPPAATVIPAPVLASTPTVEAAAPAATPTRYSDAVSPPAADYAQPTPRPAHTRKLSKPQATAATVPAKTITPDTLTPTATKAVTPAAVASPSPEASATPAAAPAPAVTHKGVSLWLLIAFVLLVIVLGTLFPSIARWRKRRMLQADGAPNLSFTNEAVPEPAEREKPERRKVA